MLEPTLACLAQALACLAHQHLGGYLQFFSEEQDRPQARLVDSPFEKRNVGSIQAARQPQVQLALSGLLACLSKGGAEGDRNRVRCSLLFGGRHAADDGDPQSITRPSILCINMRRPLIFGVNSENIDVHSIPAGTAEPAVQSARQPEMGEQ